MKHISSRDNPFYKDLVRLAGAARQRSKTGQTLLDGTHLLSAYQDSGRKPLHILINEAALQNIEIMNLISNEVPVTLLDDKLFTELSELKTPTGVISLIQIPVAEVIPAHFALLIEDVQDPGNLGSMLRSSAAAGCDAVFLSPACADAWSPKVLRAAMGGHFCLNIHEGVDLTAIAEAFQGTLLAASLQGRHSLYECNLTGNIAFMMGNEGAGLSERLLSVATKLMIIPMPGRVESLNVAAATAACLFEAVRQRTAV